MRSPASPKQKKGLMAKFGKLIYRATVDGCTVEQQITDATYDSIYGETAVTNDFTRSLKYDLTNLVCGILGNASIRYAGQGNQFTESLQKHLIDIFFTIHKYGECFLNVDDKMRVTGVSEKKGNFHVYDKAWKVSGYTQKTAVDEQMKMYGVVSNARYSIINEHGMMGVFSPKAGTEMKVKATEAMYAKFRTIFGIKSGQRKMVVTEVPMDYNGVTLPVAQLQLLDNEKRAIARIAHIMGIEEDMIISGSTFDNKEKAIVQTYANFKGKIYDWIQQIEKQTLFSFNIVENYEVSFADAMTTQPQPQTQPAKV